MSQRSAVKKAAHTVGVLACLAITVLGGCDMRRFGKNGIPAGCHVDVIRRNLHARHVTILLSDNHIYRKVSAGGVVLSGGYPEPYAVGTGVIVCPNRETARSDIAIDIKGRPFEPFERVR